MSRAPGAGRAGLTLVELLVAMTILVIVTTSTALIMRGVTQAWRTGQLRTERYQQARLVFDLCSREIASSVASPRYPLIGTDPAAGARVRPAGILGELFFVGTLPGRAGLVERGYWVTADGTLMCHDDEPADGDYSTGESEVCGRDVTQFSLSFFDGTAWVPSWDGRAASPAGALPKAIHVVLAIGEQHPEPFDIVIYVPTS